MSDRACRHAAWPDANGTRAACSAFQLELAAARKKRDACDAQNQKLDREFKRDFADTDDLFDAL